MGSSSSVPKRSVDHEKGTFEVQYISRDQGHELEECGRSWKVCTKNPGHGQFIPIGQFTMEQLPEQIRNDMMFRSIQGLVNLTVRVRANYNCEERLKYWPDHVVGFRTSVGTGCVDYVEGIIPDDEGCQCHDHDTIPGESGGSHQSKRWIIGLVTAAHVICNDEEAKCAFVDFFYDDEESRRDGRLVSLEVQHINDLSAETDWCYVHCVTDNEELALKLKDSLKTKYHANTEPYSRSINEHVIIVSHPHGQPKHISIGTEITPPKQVKNDEDIKAYNTPTCPGSSGAAVYDRDCYLHYLHYAHSRGFPHGVNVCTRLY